jgi:hypothetical protein
MNGNEKLTHAAKKLNVDLVSLVAETAIWAPPQFCKDLQREKGSMTMYPNIRRKKADEERGSIKNGIKLYDNSYTNNAIKKAIDIQRTEIKVYDTCHIWPATCYDEHFHTAIPNLVLLPSAIASLSDFFEEKYTFGTKLKK